MLSVSHRERIFLFFFRVGGHICYRRWNSKVFIHFNAAQQLARSQAIKNFIVIKMIQRLLIYSFLVVVFALGWLLKAFPVFKSFVSLAMCKITDTSLPAEIYWDSLFSWKMLQNVYHCLLIDINKRVKLGSKAYNSPVVSIEGKRCHRLLDFSRANRPLVINFGSSTCPVFMEMLRRYRHLRDQFSKVADFAVVYIEEAHPEDGWAFKVNCVCNHFFFFFNDNPA